MRLFFYGTLIAGSGNAVAARIHDRLRPAGAAQVGGRLFAIPDRGGWYPALVAGKGQVSGQLYETQSGFGEDDLARLDAYEGAAYRRQSVRAKVEQGKPVIVTAYVWRTKIPARAMLIGHGDFMRWLQEAGKTAFGS